MSLFLGPIHHWLYNKIKLQQNMVQAVITLAGERGKTLERDMISRFGALETRPLEEAIDGDNIHGWLQNQVSIAERHLAYAVTTLIKEDEKMLQKLEALCVEEGEKCGDTYESVQTMGELYQRINDSLLDGMPCDRVNEVIEREDDVATWRMSMDIHKPYWDEVGGDVKHYHQLREAWLKGFVSPHYFEKKDETTFAVKRRRYGIVVMIEEHKLILRLLKVVRKACQVFLETGEINYNHFEAIIDFIRTYADTHHHGKEEKMLFDLMEKNLGAIGTKLIRNGMYVEHDLGRLYIQELEIALEAFKTGDTDAKLDIIANAIGYTKLLERHALKENEVIYPYGEKHLSEELLSQIDKDTVAFEQEAASRKVHETYGALLEQLEAHYMK